MILNYNLVKHLVYQSRRKGSGTFELPWNGLGLSLIEFNQTEIYSDNFKYT